jgi:hypothetical protein
MKHDTGYRLVETVEEVVVRGGLLRLTITAGGKIRKYAVPLELSGKTVSRALKALTTYAAVVPFPEKRRM